MVRNTPHKETFFPIAYVSCYFTGEYDGANERQRRQGWRPWTPGREGRGKQRGFVT